MESKIKLFEINFTNSERLTEYFQNMLWESSEEDKFTIAEMKAALELFVADLIEETLENIAEDPDTELNHAQGFAKDFSYQYYKYIDKIRKNDRSN